MITVASSDIVVSQADTGNDGDRGGLARNHGGRFAASLPHGVGKFDAHLLISTVGLLAVVAAVVAVVACFLPARRAIRVQGVDALRHESFHRDVERVGKTVRVWPAALGDFR